MSDILREMRRGNRGVLRDFLRAHGRAIELLRHELDPDVPLEDLAVAVWQSSLSALGTVDARGHSLAAVVKRLVGEEREAGPLPEVDLPAFTVAAAYVHQEIGTARERGYIERALAVEPSLAELQGKVCAALDAVKRLPTSETSAFDDLWSQIEPQLR